MAHFARLDENRVVQEVIVVSNEELLDAQGDEQESLGIAFCQSLFGIDTIWLQTSYNSNFRVNFATPGDSYYPYLDAFITPKPFESWVLDTGLKAWRAPIEEPPLTQEQIDNRMSYYWDETAYQADPTTGWILHAGANWE